MFWVIFALKVRLSISDMFLDLLFRRESLARDDKIAYFQIAEESFNFNINLPSKCNDIASNWFPVMHEQDVWQLYSDNFVEEIKALNVFSPLH